VCLLAGCCVNMSGLVPLALASLTASLRCSLACPPADGGRSVLPPPSRRRRSSSSSGSSARSCRRQHALCTSAASNASTGRQHADGTGAWQDGCWCCGCLAKCAGPATAWAAAARSLAASLAGQPAPPARRACD
jgi:hypothetical protein